MPAMDGHQEGHGEELNAEELSRRARVLHLTTIGRKSGQPRTIEIWFVAYQGRLYLNAEHGLKAHWVQNIQANPAVSVRVRTRTFRAHARVLDPERDQAEWRSVADLSRQKYKWGEGLPVAIELIAEQEAGEG